MATETLTDQLIRHEGLKLKPYRCTADKLTIGVGRNLDDVGITREEALYLLNNDIEKARRDVKANIAFYDKLSEARQNVLVNMCFNLGIGGLKKFGKMLLNLERGDYNGASVEMLNSAWAKQVGSRAIELSDIMKKG